MVSASRSACFGMFLTSASTLSSSCKTNCMSRSGAVYCPIFLLQVSRKLGPCSPPNLPIRPTPNGRCFDTKQSFFPARQHGTQTRQTVCFGKAGVEPFVLKARVIFLHPLHLKILGRAEMRKHAALAHLHPFGQQADRQALESIPACQVQRGVEDCDSRLFAFSHDFYRFHVIEIKSNGRTIVIGSRS